MAPAGQYVFAEMLGISEHFGSIINVVVRR